jgi:hypothetical protein
MVGTKAAAAGLTTSIAARWTRAARWLWVGFGFCCATASAQVPSDSDLEVARDLARHGLAALEKREFAAADDLLSQAIALYDAPTLRLARGRARRESDRMLAAAEDFQVARRWPSEADEAPVFREVRGDAERELASIEARIPRLTVVLHGSGTLRVGGSVWPAASIGRPRLIDPGQYLIEALWSTGQTSRITLRLQAGQRESVELRWDPSMSNDTVANATHDTAEGRAPTRPLAAHRASERSAPWTANTPALILGGVSAALLVASIVTGVETLALNSDFERLNTPEVPESAKKAKREEVVTMRAVSSALMGAALLGAGVTVYLLLSPSAAASTDVTSTGAGRRELGFQATLVGRF